LASLSQQLCRIKFSLEKLTNKTDCLEELNESPKNVTVTNKANCPEELNEPQKPH
jgi:hypothetical protein